MTGTYQATPLAVPRSTRLIRRIVPLIGVGLIAWIVGASDAGAYVINRPGDEINYFVTNYVGTIQCARAESTWPYTDNGGLTIRSSAYSVARRDVFCANRFDLPTGWIGNSGYIQRFDFAAATWVTVAATSVGYSAVSGWYWGSFPWLRYSPGLYRAASFNNVLEAGAWRSYWQFGTGVVL